MRFLKPLLIALVALVAVTAGLVVTMFVAVAGAGVLLARRLLRSGPRTAMSGTVPAPARSPSRPAGDAIDVVATEVTSDSTRP